MLSQSDIDQLEGYLCKASLNDLPNVLMKVLPLLFAELRTMQRALDNQAEDFFRGIPGHDGRGRVAVGGTGVGGAVFSGSQEAAAAPQAARTAESVHAVHPVSPQRKDASGPAGPNGEDQVRAVPMVGAGVGPAVGGEVRTEEGHRPATGSQPDVAVKKRRGRPSKKSAVLDAVLGIEPIKHGGE